MCADCSPSWRETLVGTQAGQTPDSKKQSPWKSAACRLVPPGLLGLLSDTLQDHLPAQGGHPPYSVARALPINNQSR